jgi:RNA polymerase sigma-70 factor (ECF subfamily)
MRKNGRRLALFFLGELNPPLEARFRVDHHVTPDLLSRLLDEHGGALALFAAQWTDCADDCVQEALIELARQPACPPNPVAWLFRVVRNKAISHSRAARRRERREQFAYRLRPQESATSVEQIDSTDVAAAVASLPDEQREVVVARTWGQLNFEQIAELVGCSISTAHRRYEAGLAALRERLELPCLTKTTNRTR